MTFLCCGFLLGLLLIRPCIAHDSKHPEFDSWYRGLKNPNFKSAVIQDLGCCSVRDYHETDADIRNGHWWARVGKLHTKYLGPKPPSEAQHVFDLVYEEILGTDRVEGGAERGDLEGSQSHWQSGHMSFDLE
jgi:hypothetical protein